MARNKVQFQKGLSEAQFAVLYGTEDQCREAVMRWRWPSGFVCPVCAGQHHSFVKTRALYQCAACRRQTSLIAGTIFAATKVPLCTWFRDNYHLTQSKGGISSIELGRRLGVTQTTAWKIKHKLMQAMMERDATKRLTGRIEIDDGYLGGGGDRGQRGRGSPRTTRRAGGRLAWQDADRGGGQNHPRGKANPLEVAPREGFPPCRNRELGAAQF